MKTDAEQLKFVVAFATDDLDTYRTGDWQNLRDDLQVFLQGGLRDGESIPHRAGQEHFVSSERVAKAPEESLRTLRNEVAGLLDRCVALRDAHSQGRERGFNEVAGRPFDVSVRKTLITVENDIAGVVEGRLRDVVLEKVYQLLIRNPIRPLRRCPVCGRIFYRVKKKQYCRRKCFVTAWLSTSEGKKSKRTTDREYAKKIRRARAVSRPWPTTQAEAGTASSEGSAKDGKTKGTRGR